MSDIKDIIVKPSEIIVDLSYQRDPKARLPTLRKIAAEFDEKRFGVPHVRRRPDGTIAVIDGAGRMFVLSEILKLDKEVRCIDHCHITSVEEEAEWFLKLNPDTVRKVSPLDKFRAKLAMHDETATDLFDAAKKGGLKIGGQGTTAISLAAAETLMKLGSLTKVGRIKKDVWPDIKVAPWAFIGIGALLYCAPSIDEERLCHVLAQNPPNQLETKLRQAMRGWPHARDIPPLIAQLIGDLYNSNLKKAEKRIYPEWARVDRLLGSEFSDRWGKQFRAE
jgi:hypothetical protein